jgi:O-antigen ligase
MVCLLAFLASREARARFLHVLSQPIGIAATVMLASIVIGASYGVAIVQQRIDELQHNRVWLFIPMLAALFADERAKRTIATVFILFCGLAAIVSFLSWWGGFAVRGGVHGTVFRDYVTQGMGFAIAGFVGAMLIACRLDSGSKPLLIVLLVSVVLCVANVIFVTVGRSGHVALVFLVVSFFVWHATKKGIRWPGVLVAVIVVSAIGSSSMIRDRFKLGLTEAATVSEQKTETSVGQRITFWENTTALIRDRPLFGYGTGGFESAYADSVRGVAGWKGSVTTDPHNQYLLTAAERGIAGLVALFATILLLVRQKNAGHPWREIGLAVIGVWCLTNLVNSHFHTFDQSHMFVLLVGAFLAPMETNTTTEPRESV